MHHEKVRPWAPFHFSEAKSVHSVLFEPICQSDVPGAILGAVSRRLTVQAFIRLALLKEQADNKQVMSEGEKPATAGVQGRR